ncbi:thiamine pyrophosphate-binding protein [Halorarius litoreus]|uniref:thiamine pyrophosphate-binding protein n=1 Tax=Halorarius litoreus TaxID=2962676 RepID=UPI0020CB8B7C|nr:thiamine pyrophosphate-binding protein [Halorarius litoreus]
MKLSDAIIRLLVEENVDTLFTLMAEDVMGITATARADWADDLSVVDARHEQLAMAMADGYARTHDDIGVCVVGRGPAIAQTGTALGTANVYGSKLLVITGETPTTTLGGLKYFDQETFLGPVTEDVLSVRDEDALLPVFRDAFRRLRRDRGPIVVQVPWNLMDAETDLDVDWETELFGTDAVDDAARRRPDAEKVTAAVDRYLESDASTPPVILAGRGAVASGAKPAIERLAERTSALLATSLQARGYFSDHPFSIGFPGTFGSNLANEYVTNAAFVLAVGCSLNNHTTDVGRLVDEATVVHVTDEPAHLERYTPVDLAVVGDARETVAAIDAELDEMGMDFSGTFWTENTERRLADAEPWGDATFVDTPGRMDPRELMVELDARLPDERLVVTDAGHFMNWVIDGITVDHPDDYMWTLDFGAIGIGFPMGIGAAWQEDERTPVTFVGDAGFLMSLQALDTAVQQWIPSVTVVVNDDALGSEYHQLKNRNLNASAAVAETPDLAALARDFGAEAHTITSVADLDAVDLSTRPSGPVVLDCKIDRDVKHRFYESDHMN